MKLFKTIHRSSGHSARVFILPNNAYIVEFYNLGKHFTFKDYFTDTLQDAIDTAQLELMLLQDMDD